MDKINIKPLGDRVLVKTVEDSESQGEFTLVKDTDEGEKRPHKGLVIDKGEGFTNDQGKRMMVNEDIQKGSIVYFTPYSSDPITVNGETYYFIRSISILGLETNI